MVAFQTTLQCKLMLTWEVDVLIPAPVLFLKCFHLGIELKSVSSFYISFAYLNLIFQDSAYFIFPCSQDIDHGLWELCILCASLLNQFMLFCFICKSVTLCSLSLRPLKCPASFAVTYRAVWIIFLNVLPNTSLAQARLEAIITQNILLVFSGLYNYYIGLFFFLAGIRQLWLSCNLSIFLSLSMGM